MNISLPATELKRIVKKLSTVQSVNVKLGDGFASATDGDMGIIIGKSLETPILVNAKLFFSVVNKLTKDVHVFHNGAKLVVKSAKFSAELPILTETNQPLPVSSLSELEIEAKELSNLLTFASIVTDDKVTFDYTGAVQLAAIPDTYWTKYEVTATDNHRIAIVSNDKGKGVYPKTTLLIPSKVVKAVKELEGMVNISQNDTTIFFQSGDTTIYTRKLSKKFPDVGKVIPKSYKLEVGIKTQDFIDAIGRVSSTTDLETSSKVLLSFNGDVLILNTGNSLIGQSQDEISVNPLIPDTLDEPYPLKIGVNGRYILQYLTSIKDCDIVFKANDSSQPFLMEAGSKKILMAGIKI